MLNNHTFYSGAYTKHGVSPQGVNWHSQETQEIRFQVIVNLLKNELYESSIADAGCGFGDFYLFLHAQGLAPKHYIGIDVMEEFLEVAKKRLEHARGCSFACKDVLKEPLPRVDWYVCSGALNILSDFNTWLFIEKMLLYARKGVVFNILQGRRGGSDFNYKEKEEMVNFLEEKGLEYEIIEGYLEKDMTIKVKV
ncbi:MAG: class I SAM-dependent methyltransferase [Sulfurospirillaceae bacterium]|jgi:SAM-dependent methyltransferase|nr:class I SAM-dependent methyltransferase [Sulfurospirillaceae bacterium]MDD2826859.1 class I SAM-dependent methyltransferase [Sulfurospirillaceae bacterium]